MTRRQGYTLVELLVVAVLAVSLLGIAAAGYHTWVKTTAADASMTLLLAELERARANALARCCATRVAAVFDERGDGLLSERLDPETGEKWFPIARTNRLSRTHVEPDRLYFRPDGSCCTNENLLVEEADFAEYRLELRSEKARSTSSVTQDKRIVTVNARTGLAREGEVSSKPREAKQ